MTQFKIVIFALVGLLVVVLAVQNHEVMSQPVQFRSDLPLLGEIRTGSVNLYQLVAAAFVFGVLVAGMHGMIEGYRLRRKIKSLTRELQDKDRELNSLRNLPITSQDAPGQHPGGI